MNNLKYLKNVTTLILDEEKCIKCGMCLEVCPHAVFDMAKKSAKIINSNACMECGACAKNCSVEAIKVNAGVGCAAAVINQMLGLTSECCCGPLDQKPGTKSCC